MFVRFTGCNLWNGNINKRKNAKCNFCDTNFVGIDGLNGGRYNLDQLVKKFHGLEFDVFKRKSLLF